MFLKSWSVSLSHFNRFMKIANWQSLTSQILIFQGTGHGIFEYSDSRSSPDSLPPVLVYSQWFQSTRFFLRQKKANIVDRLTYLWASLRFHFLSAGGWTVWAPTAGWWSDWFSLFWSAWPWQWVEGASDEGRRRSWRGGWDRRRWSMDKQKRTRTCSDNHIEILFVLKWPKTMPWWEKTFDFKGFIYTVSDSQSLKETSL